MSRRNREVSQSPKTVTLFTCDLCDKDFDPPRYCPCVCRLCKRDVCNKCGRFDKFDEDGVGPLCNRCREFREEYEKQIAGIREYAEFEEDKILKEWQNKSLEVP